MSEKRPLVTFLVIGCNFEKFVRESVEGAFAQTYSPLEIILSDDCSNDGTFEIMRTMAAEYKGPHLVRLNRFDRRQGFGAHISYLLCQAKGQLHVINSADDVSLPERTELVVQAWEKSGHKANLIYSRFNLIDQYSRPIEGDHGGSLAAWEGLVKSVSGSLSLGTKTISYVEHRPDAHDYASRKVQVKASGCANSVSSEIIRLFGPIFPDLILEDLVFIFRALLIGPVTFINEPLVKYRRHNLNHSGAAGDNKQRQIDHCRWNILVFDQYAKDIEAAVQQKVISLSKYKELSREIRRQRRFYELKSNCLTASPWRIPEMACRLVANGAGPRTILKELNGMIR